jgi:hypothetical protein
MVEKHYPDSKRRVKMYASIPLLLVMLVAVIAAFTAVKIYKSTLGADPEFGQYHQAFGGLLNGIVITVLNGVYKKLALKFTEWENWKTQTT